MDSQKPAKAPKTAPNAPKPTSTGTDNPKSKTSPDKTREVARRAEAKFVGKVANPKLKATGKAPLKAAQNDHMSYNSNNSGYNTGPRLGSTREQAPSPADENNDFVIRH